MSPRSLSPSPQEESGSGSELDSPPRLNIITELVDLDACSPRGGSPPLMDRMPTVRRPFGSDTEESHSSDADEDPYFKSLVDNFIIASKDVYEPTLPEDVIDKADHQRQSDFYAESALKHYNNDKKNKVKYELIRAITSCGIIDENGCYGHVNFTAKGNPQHSREEFFFAELRREGFDNYVPTCVLPLEEGKRVGGLRDTRYDNFSGMGLPIDAKHCYACGRGLKHPKNGALYVTGHVASSDYYHG